MAECSKQFPNGKHIHMKLGFQNNYKYNPNVDTMKFDKNPTGQFYLGTAEGRAFARDAPAGYGYLRQMLEEKENELALETAAKQEEMNRLHEFQKMQEEARIAQLQAERQSALDLKQAQDLAVWEQQNIPHELTQSIDALTKAYIDQGVDPKLAKMTAIQKMTQGKAGTNISVNTGEKGLWKIATDQIEKSDESQARADMALERELGTIEQYYGSDLNKTLVKWGEFMNELFPGQVFPEYKNRSDAYKASISAVIFDKQPGTGVMTDNDMRFMQQTYGGPLNDDAVLLFMTASARMKSIYETQLNDELNDQIYADLAVGKTTNVRKFKREFQAKFKKDKGWARGAGAFNDTKDRHAYITAMGKYIDAERDRLDASVIERNKLLGLDTSLPTINIGGPAGIPNALN